jgi:hypothetical protein
MQQGHNPRRVGDEDRNTIRHAHGQRYSSLGGNVAVCLFTPKPSLPPTGMDQHAYAMDLPDRREAPGNVGNFVLDGGPPAHDFVHRVVAREAERAGVTSGRERADPPTLEVGDYFFRNLSHGY